MDRSWAFWRRVAVDRVRQTVSLLQRLRGLTEKHKGHKEGSSNASGSVHCCCLLPLALFDNEFGWYAQGASAANKTLERYPLRKKMCYGPDLPICEPRCSRGRPRGGRGQTVAAHSGLAHEALVLGSRLKNSAKVFAQEQAKPETTATRVQELGDWGGDKEVELP